ncbi:FAD-dependent oxidoreductase [Pseudomonas corrugata]|uniref:FAD-dependent oxidoreductase n=1 Tax=Pseudomonas corrugata TaxID=47879 RepID=UPI001C2F489F
MTEPIIVVGAGLAGYGVLRELRKLDANVPLTLITADSGDFYSKPMLSTALSKGKDAAQLVSTAATVMAEQQRFSLYANTRIERIDKRARTVFTDRGEMRYSKLVLALGGKPIRLPLSGDAADKVLSINDLHDYSQFRLQLEGKRHVGIIGAGLIGCEFANDLSASGYSVSVIEPQSRALANLVPAKTSEHLQAALSAQGVDWHFGQGVIAVDHCASGYVLVLADGGRIEADLVISAVGLRPRTELAAEAGLETRRGININTFGQTCDPHIYALGDCAEYPVGLCLYITPIMATARAIAASALGTPIPIRFPPLSVIVKTSAYPLALLRPQDGLEGEWLESESDAHGMKLLFRDLRGLLAGYVLGGNRSSQRAELDRKVGMALEPDSPCTQ